MPVADGAQSLIQVVRRLDEANIELVDLRLRRPSLDDVFLNLTGGTARQAEPTTSGALTSSPDGRDSGQKGQN
jgi:ABC-2 type transport system ATP-binding protein